MRKANVAFWGSVGVLAVVSVGCSSGGSGSPNPSSSSNASSASVGSNSGTTSIGGSGSSGSGSGTSGGSSPSTTSTSGSSSAATGDGGTPAPDGSTQATAYPSGPYCAAAGQNGHLPDSPGCVLPPTIPPNATKWMGYVDDNANALASTEPYVTYSFADAFNYAQQNGKKYLMVNVAEFTCPGCGESAAIMSVTDDAGVPAAAAVVHAGGMLIEVLESANFTGVPTQMQLQTWISDPTAAQGRHALWVTTVADPPSSSGTPSWNFFGRRDQAYIVDLTTMKIIKYIDGNIGPTTGGTGNSGPQAMSYMHTLLGK
jgi:hypothetical protein